MQSSDGWVPVYADASQRLSVMSIAFLLKSTEEAVVWRGPKKNAMIKQFIEDVIWGPLDFLIIDTPPGTSDEQAIPPILPSSFPPALLRPSVIRPSLLLLPPSLSASLRSPSVPSLATLSRYFSFSPPRPRVHLPLSLLLSFRTAPNALLSLPCSHTHTRPTHHILTPPLHFQSQEERFSYQCRYAYYTRTSMH